MTYPVLKISLKIGTATALLIILFWSFNILRLYGYINTDFYIIMVAVVFLAAGFLISKQQQAATPLVLCTDPLTDLTPKELLILTMIIDGKSNKEIAGQNFVAISTIKTHINNIYNKLGIQNRREVIAKFTSKI